MTEGTTMKTKKYECRIKHVREILFGLLELQFAMGNY